MQQKALPVVHRSKPRIFLKEAAKICDIAEVESIAYLIDALA